MAVNLPLVSTTLVEIWQIIEQYQAAYNLKGPSMTKLRADFFTQIRDIWLDDLGTGEKNSFHLWLFGADIRNFVFLANAEHTVKIM